MDIKIVNAEEKHIPDIAALEREYFSLPWSEDSLKTCLNGQHIFLSALYGDKLIGYVSIDYVLDEGYFNNIAVSREYRRKGAAQALLSELDRQAEEKELSFISLEVRKSNESALELYRKNGYQEVGIRKKYYEKPVEDAIIMTKFLK